MKPLPAQKSAGDKPRGGEIPSLPTILTPASGSFSKSNRRQIPTQVPGIYPWLLSASTGLAALFCIMYITKPVIVGTPVQTAVTPVKVVGKSPPASTPAVPSGLMPSADRLPGEQVTPAQQETSGTQVTRSHPLPGPASGPAFEETNLRIQHILTAEAPGGHLDRIDVDVPVLYRSRNLRWTAGEVAEARSLMLRLMEYQDKSRQLHSDGAKLLDSWNRLVNRSIPSTDLRADSPTLPANQEDAGNKPHAEGQLSSDSILIQHPGK